VESLDLFTDDEFPPEADEPRSHRFSEEVLAETMNEGQLQAVIHPALPLMVVAGAGSGKTRVITYRLARLIDSGTSPHRIFAVTFTNKAAAELRNRASVLLGDTDRGIRGLWLGTFHSLSARLLRQYGDAVGLTRDFVIYDTDDQKRLLTQIMKDLSISDRNFPVKQIQWAIDQAQNQGIDSAHFKPGDYFEDVVGKVYATYEQRLKKSNAVDFGGLLLNALALCRPDSPVMVELANRFDHVLVDEFQDTNRVQYRMVRFLSHATQSITVVGDEDQSIYKWRGADIRNILDFEKDHPGCGMVKLEENYRSTAKVLRAANSIISKNRERREKNLFTRGPDGDSIVVFEGETERDEANFIATQIDEALRHGDVSPRDFAVFYRTNGQSRVLEDAMRARDIPYLIVGGTRFFDRLEIKNVISYLRVLQNPEDGVGLLRIINTPTRGIGDTTVLKVAALANELGISVSQALLHAAGPEGGLGAATAKKLAAFVALMDKLRTAAQTLGPAALAEKVLEDTGYQASLAAEASLEAEGRLENLMELVALMREYESEAANLGDPPSLAGFLERVALVADIDSYDPDKGAVSMMTVHTAKGLEFPRVFVTGMEEGVFPHQRSLEDDTQLEEERRLCYVAVTRAMKRLYMTRARVRRLGGQMFGGAPSRFLRDVPEDCAEHLVMARPSYYNVDTDESGPWQGGWNRGGAPKRPASAQATSSIPPAPPKVSAPRSFVPDEDPGSSHPGLRVGAKLRHSKFGLGEVKGWTGTGEDLKVTMKFNSVGIKTILSKFLSAP